MSTIVPGYVPVPFIAACPSCGLDASWVARMDLIVAESRRELHHHIDCRACGPCPCPHHDAKD